MRTLPLVPPLLDALAAVGITQATEVQRACIPPLLDGEDLLAQAPTGSGKTLAYGLPLLQRLSLDARERRLQALVLCPTRELAAQVTRELRRAAVNLPGVRVAEVCGGVPGGRQRATLEAGVHIVVGTPGRCLDLLERGAMPVGDLRAVVLDEADRMLDLGFGPDVTRILEGLPQPYQLALFSATLPEAIRAWSTGAGRSAREVHLGGEPPALRHELHRIGDLPREEALIRVLDADPAATTLVFTALKETARTLSRALGSAGVAAAALHGDLEQHERDGVLARFRNGTVRVLVATDVAARGIDVGGLDRVVAYDPAGTAEILVHRAGRAGRAGREGLAIALGNDRQAARIAEQAAAMGIVLHEAPLPAARQAATRRGDENVPAETAPLVTLVIGGGRRDKLRPGDLLGALTGAIDAGGAGLSGAEVGRIEIRDDVTYVAVVATAAERARSALREGRIKGRRFRVS